jgi:hypothetical protein
MTIRGYLCVGGPRDGQFLAPDPMGYRCEVFGPLPTFGALTGAVSPEPPDLRTTYYDRAVISFEGSEVSFLVERGTRPSEVLRMLLDNYRPVADGP